MDSDAIVVARWRDKSFCEWPESAQKVIADDSATRLEWLAAVEALIVERGMGEAYGRALATALSPELLKCDRYDGYAMIRTAPPATILRALAATIRAAEKKEKT
jgi:hypothetical protein